MRKLIQLFPFREVIASSIFTIPLLLILSACLSEDYLKNGQRSRLKPVPSDSDSEDVSTSADSSSFTDDLFRAIATVAELKLRGRYVKDCLENDERYQDLLNAPQLDRLELQLEEAEVVLVDEPLTDVYGNEVYAQVRNQKDNPDRKEIRVNRRYWAQSLASVSSDVFDFVLSTYLKAAEIDNTNSIISRALSVYEEDYQDFAEEFEDDQVPRNARLEFGCSDDSSSPAFGVRVVNNFGQSSSGVAEFGRDNYPVSCDRQLENLTDELSDIPEDRTVYFCEIYPGCYRLRGFLASPDGSVEYIGNVRAYGISSSEREKCLSDAASRNQGS